MLVINTVGLHLALESVLGALLLFILAAYWRGRGQHAARVKAGADLVKLMEERLNANDVKMAISDGKLAALALAVQPLAALMTQTLVKTLTHLHLPEADALLAAVGPPNTLSPAQEARLAELMLSRINKLNASVGPIERNAAQLLPLMIERNRLEAGLKEALDLRLVGVPKAHE
jgi:hypothetical protein